jgi:sigma-B regulation protein RsbU (phosphoserine phosphatase)
MACVDTSGNPRIPALMKMVGAISRARDPHEVLFAFASGIRELYGPMGIASLSTRGLPPGQYRLTRLMVEADPRQFASVNSWSHADELPAHSGGLLGDIIRSAYPEIIHNVDLRNDPVIGATMGRHRSLMAIPLFDDGEPVNWSFVFREDPEGFTVDELEEWILRSNLVGGTVRTTMMARQLQSAHSAIQDEVERIASIQRALLPSEMPEITGVRLAASYATFDQAGGDYYDFLPLHARPCGTPDPDGRWGILIADASGHGPSAAVVMAMLQSLMHAYPQLPDGPAEVLEHANRHLCAKRIEGSFVTALLAVYDPTTCRMTYARAGHNPPLHMWNDGGEGWHIDHLDKVGSLPLGVIDTVDYEETTLQLRHGQTVVFYTDGITEARNTDGTMFGVAGIERSLTECTGEPDCVIGHVTGALKVHESGVRPDDDQTLVVMRIG